MEWAFILIFLILIFVASYVLVRYQVGHKVAAKRLPIVFVLMAAGMIGIFALFRLVPTEWKDHTWSGYALLLSFAIWVFLAILIRRAAQAGDILLEFGRPRGGLVIGIVGAGGGLLAGIASIVQAIVDSNAGAATQLRHLSWGLNWLSLAVFILFSWLSKWSIRERGIMFYGQLLTWEKIKAFQWDQDKPTTLALSVKRRFGWWQTVYIRIPTEKQEAATEILGRNLSPNIEGGRAS